MRVYITLCEARAASVVKHLRAVSDLSAANMAGPIELTTCLRESKPKPDIKKPTYSRALGRLKEGCYSGKKRWRTLKAHMLLNGETQEIIATAFGEGCTHNPLKQLYYTKLTPLAGLTHLLSILYYYSHKRFRYFGATRQPASCESVWGNVLEVAVSVAYKN